MNNSSNSKITNKFIKVSVNSSGNTAFAYPSGFNQNNIVMVGASCKTKYGSIVDSSYADENYFGDLIYNPESIELRPKVAGNVTEVNFIFMRTT